MGVSVNFDGDKVLAWVIDRWGRWSSLLLVEFILFVSLLVLLTDKKIYTITLPQVGLMLVCMLVLWFVWWLTVRVPKNKAGKVGIMLAVYAEDGAQQKLVDSDFLQVFQETLDRSESKEIFNIVNMPRHHSKHIQTADQADSYRRVSRCHMIIFGRTRKRIEQGKEVIKVHLTCQVAHRQIKEVVGRAFSQDISEIFPSRLNVDVENECQEFEITSDWLNLASKYIIGTAALLSADVDLAQSVFEPMYESLRKKKPVIPAVKKIKQRLVPRLIDIYRSQIFQLHLEWERTREAICLERQKPLVEKFENIDPGNYGLKLTRSIIYFVLDHDPQKALREVVSCRQVRDATWRYSYAFLLAYIGRLGDAKKAYDRAFDYTTHESVPLQCESFISWVLSNEPEKVQLHYCLGLINWHVKGDFPQAIDDMQKFLELASDEEFPEMKRVAEANIETIRGELNGTIRTSTE
jgi:hypothetical protein